MKPYYERSGIRLYHGDAADVLPTLDAESISAVVSDPPAGIAFMSKSWDRDRGGRDQWVAWLASILSECNRAMKPGAHAVIWALPRTSGWTQRAIEDARLEVRDCLVHLFGSGFPKSHDVSKAIDKAAPRVGMFDAFARHYAERRKASGMTHAQVCALGGFFANVNHGGASVNWEAGYNVPTREQWDVLAPALGLSDEWLPLIERVEAEREKIGKVTKGSSPLPNNHNGAWNDGQQDGTFDITAPATDAAREWEGWGTALKPGAEFWYLARKPLSGTVAANVLAHGTGALNIDACRVGTGDDRSSGGPSGMRANGKSYGGFPTHADDGFERQSGGRWPANVVLDEHAAALLDEQSGELGKSERPNPKRRGTTNNVYGTHRDTPFITHRDSHNGASRFFYCAKSSRRERTANGTVPNGHATVKPLALMRWLLTLVTPPGGTVLDPFAGSGTTGVAAAALGIPCVLIEQEAEYLPIIAGRIDHALDERQEREALPRQLSIAD